MAEPPARPAAEQHRPEPAPAPVVVGLAEMLRSARHQADLSQRELADLACVSHGLIGDIESGMLAAPRYTTLEKILSATGCRLVAVDAQGNPLRLRPHDDVRDRGGRRFPSHLEVREVTCLSDWWGTWALPHLPLPPYTADWRRVQNRPRVRRNKAERDADARRRAPRSTQE